MHWHLIPVPFILVTIGLYVVARAKNDLKRVAVVQPVGTILAVAVCALSLLSPHAVIGFTAFILVGLILSLVGDFLNVDMTSQKVVMVGLVIFVFAYLVYAVGMAFYNGFHGADVIVAGILLIILCALMAYLWADLGPMKIPFVIYGVILCIMVNRAVSTFFGDAFSTTQAVLLTAGTLMIFFGDMLFAITSYKKPSSPPLAVTLNLAGPGMYAGAQLLIALAPSYFPGG
jgi:uncharacterized membrane protein YhhN